MEPWVGHVMELRPEWNPMQSFGIGWDASDKVANKRFDPYHLDHAWHEYNGIYEYDEIPEGEPYKLFGRGPAQSRDEAIARIRDFFNALS